MATQIEKLQIYIDKLLADRTILRNKIKELLSKRETMDKSKKHILKQKTTYAGLAIIATALLPAFGVSPEIILAIIAALNGFGMIFLRQSIKNQN